ncbi:MFS transporter [Saccharothrix coeruleofusca]|uniref:MFS transporter n=1 Tax=Saccharothrix coeruleofusca TaxID=33919 RepID=UPI001AE80604
MPVVSARTRALAAASVAAGTSGYVVAAVLPELAADLDVTLASAGQVLTAFALAYAVGSPVLAVLTAGWERRALIVAALVVAALGNLASALAPGLGPLLAARVVTACGAALTTPAATAVAAQLHPPGTRARAMAVVTGGLTAATVLGVPAGRAVVELAGPRAAFALTAGLCLLAAAVVALVVPATPAGPPLGLRQRLALPGGGAGARRLLLVSLLSCLATFSVYGYLTPLLTAGPAALPVSLLLLAYGVGGVLGNVLGGRAADRRGPRGPLLVALFGTAVALVLLRPALGDPVAVVAVLTAWGGLFWAFNPPLFAALVAVDPGRAGVLLALNASAIYLGIAGAGVVGGAVTATAGVQAVPVVGAVTAALAACVALSTRSPGRRRATAQAGSRAEPEGEAEQVPAAAVPLDR